MPDPSEIEVVYSYLLNALANAARKGDADMREKVISAIELFERLWPEDCKRWVDRCTPPMSGQNKTSL